MSAEPTNYEAQRRGTRVRFEIPLILRSLDHSQPFSERCLTLVVNPQGCGVRSPHSLEPGTVVSLESLPGGGQVSGRVANCCPIGSDGKFWLVGIALDQTGNFWGIPNPPTDWATAPAQAAAAAAGAGTSKSSREWPYSQFSRRGEFHPGRK